MTSILHECIPGYRDLENTDPVVPYEVRIGRSIPENDPL